MGYCFSPSSIAYLHRYKSRLQQGWPVHEQWQVHQRPKRWYSCVVYIAEKYCYYLKEAKRLQEIYKEDRDWLCSAESHKSIDQNSALRLSAICVQDKYTLAHVHLCSKSIVLTAIKGVNFAITVQVDALVEYFDPMIEQEKVQTRYGTSKQLPTRLCGTLHFGTLNSSAGHW